MGEQDRPISVNITWDLWNLASQNNIFILQGNPTHKSVVQAILQLWGHLSIYLLASIEMFLYLASISSIFSNGCTDNIIRKSVCLCLSSNIPYSQFITIY